VETVLIQEHPHKHQVNCTPSVAVDEGHIENMAYARQSRPDSGLGFQEEIFKLFLAVPCSLESSKFEHNYFAEM